MSGLTTSDKEHQLYGKDLLGRKFDVRTGATITTHDQEIEHGGEPLALDYGVLESNVVNDKNVARSRLQSQVAEFQQVIDKQRNQGYQELIRFAREVTESRVVDDNNTLPTLEFYDLELTLETINEGNFLWVRKVATEWIPLYSEVVDEELGVSYIIKEEVIEWDISYVLPGNTKTAFHSYKQVDSLRAILTTVSIPGFDRTYVDTDAFTFPAILLGFEPLTTGVIPAQGRTVYPINPIIRSAFTKFTYLTVRERLMTEAEVTSIRAVPPSGNGTDTILAELLDLRPTDIQYQGELFGLNIPNVLTDDGTITATTDGADEFYGAWSETATIYASTPTASDYVADIGEERVIEDSINPWKFGLYFRKTVSLELA